MACRLVAVEDFDDNVKLPTSFDWKLRPREWAIRMIANRGCDIIGWLICYYYYAAVEYGLKILMPLLLDCYLL